MQPVSCNHCGYNYMRHNLDPNTPRLCNSCEVRENQRNPKGNNKMDTVDILIKFPRDEQIEVEEFCINHGIDYSHYFLELHQVNLELHQVSRNLGKNLKDKFKKGLETIRKEISDEEVNSPPKPSTKGKKK